MCISLNVNYNSVEFKGSGSSPTHSAMICTMSSGSGKVEYVYSMGQQSLW